MLVLLDLDNTLVDRDGAFGSWATDYVAEAGGTPADLAWLIESDAHGYAPRVSLATQMRDRLGDSTPVEALVERLLFEHVSAIELYRGVEDGLHALRAGGARLVVVTNGTTAQQTMKVERVGLDALVDGVVISEAVGAKKPATEIFEAARQHSPDASPVWMVGDHPRADIEGARGMGFATGWVSHRRTWPSELQLPDVTGHTTVAVLEALSGHPTSDRSRAG